MRVVPPLAIYVHFPWCVAKCPYCDFNSHTLRGELPAERYVDALLRDLADAHDGLGGRTSVAVFLGGGTPSLFPPEQMARLLAALRESGLDPAAEVTMEANPGAIEHADFAGYRAAGINRLSLGAQSFSDAKLKRLGRIHSSADIVTAFREARNAGFTNINLDVMFALPEQTPDEALADLHAALELAPEHVSHYQLTLEPNTVFFARPPALPDDDAAWEMQESCGRVLAEAGYEHYEVSAWARPGRASRHNLNYWCYGDYLGIGAGAHSKLTGSDGTIRREVRTAHPGEYLARVERGALERVTHTVSAEDAAFEFMLNVLRLCDGFRAEAFEAMTGRSAELLRPGLVRAREGGLLERDASGRWRPTANGSRFLNDLQALFLPERAA